MTRRSPPTLFARRQGLAARPGRDNQGDTYDEKGLTGLCEDNDRGAIGVAWDAPPRQCADSDTRIWTLALLVGRMQLGSGTEYDHVRHAESLDHRSRQWFAFGESGGSELRQSN